MVMFALGYILRAAWNGARDRAPGQELRLLLFAIVFTLVQLAAGDQLYGSNAVIFWFIGGPVMAYDFRRRQAEASVRRQPVRARRRRGARRLHVDPLQAVDHARPGVALLDHLAVALAHGPAQRGVDQQLLQRGRQRRGVADRHLAPAVVGHQMAQPPGVGGHHRPPQAIASSAVMPNGSP